MVKYRLSTFGTSCNWPRVMSPTPGRSTLITSAPNHASNCVQVGPDWTWVKSRMRTPFSALVMMSLLGICNIYCRHARESGHPVLPVDSIGHGLHLTLVRRLLNSPPEPVVGRRFCADPLAGNDADGLIVISSSAHFAG